MRVPALALLGVFGLAAASIASATAAPAAPAISAPAVSNIVQVAHSCGRGFHRNYRGFCVPNHAYRPYSYYRRYHRPYGYYYGGGNEFLNRPSPSDHVANWLNGQEARRSWGRWGY